MHKLLEAAGLTSVNRLCVSAVCLETWEAYNYMNGHNGARTPLGTAVFGPSAQPAKQTRATTSGLVRPTSSSCLARSMAEAWNMFESLRAAKSLMAVKRVAKEIAKMTPL